MTNKIRVTYARMYNSECTECHPKQANTLLIQQVIDDNVEEIAEFGIAFLNEAYICAETLALKKQCTLEIPDGMTHAIQIRDGWVPVGAKVWWRGENGPVHVVLKDGDLRNAREYPECYSIAKPSFKVQYTD